jgi:hypothetical protein
MFDNSQLLPPKEHIAVSGNTTAVSRYATKPTSLPANENVKFYLRERPGIHCIIRGWVGPMAGLDGYGKRRLHRNSMPGPSSP